MTDIVDKSNRDVEEELRDIKLEKKILEEGKKIFADKIVEKIVYGGAAAAALTLLGIAINTLFNHPK